MPQVICTLPNASALINGVKFSAHKEGKISEEIPEAFAARFLSIEGYKLADAKPAAKKEAAPKAPEAVAAPAPAPAPEVVDVKVVEKK